MVWKKLLKKLAMFFLKVALKSAWYAVDTNKDGSISKREAKEFWNLIKKYFMV